MGQYYKGTKIGTCESMYYLRLATAKKLAETGEKDDDDIKFDDYISDNVTRFRFPFPDEDEIEDLISVKKHDRGIKFQAFNLISGGHSQFTVNCSSLNLNVFLPCLYTTQFKDLVADRKIGLSFGDKTPYIEVTMEGIRHGQLRTVWRCSCCRSMCWFSEDDIAKWKEQVTPLYAPSHLDDDTSRAKKLEMLEIINRIS